MPEWAYTARAEMERYCERARQAAAASGADANEVVEDLKRHVDAEVQAAGLTVVTEAQLHLILARLGEPATPPVETKDGTNSPPLSTRPLSPSRRQRAIRSFFFYLLGVVLPVVTLVFELVTRWSSEALFDPIANWGQLLMVAYVPVSNLGIAILLARNQTKDLRRLGLANGIAMGICAFYSLLYLPFTPFAVLGIIVFGAGLMPLSPYFALGATAALQSRLNQLAEDQGRSRSYHFLMGLAASVLIIVPCVYQVPVTNYFSRMALSPSTAEAAKGIH